MKKHILSFVVLLALAAGCASPAPEITQVNTIDSLLAGFYDGTMSLRELGEYGNFGIGTVDKLDGELLLLDGEFYHIKADGKAYRLPLHATTPFAAVVDFQPDRIFSATGTMTFPTARAYIDAKFPNQNIFTAIKIHGTFSKVHTRSVPAQVKPYKPLTEVTKHQPEFKMKNITGTIVGFRLPTFVKGINVPGYHLHFISDDLQHGGHLLDFELEKGVIEIAEVHRFRMFLPENANDFAAIDLAKDRTQELHDAESAKTQ